MVKYIVTKDLNYDTSVIIRQPNVTDIKCEKVYFIGSGTFDQILRLILQKITEIILQDPYSTFFTEKSLIICNLG